jgi:hypothetical protein
VNRRRSIALRARPAPRAKRPSGRRTKILAGLAAGLAALLVIVLAIGALATRGGDQGGTVNTATAAASRVVEGVEVQAASVDLGRQPLNKEVSHSFVVKNTNDRTVQLGVPAIEVLDGC